MVRSLGRPDVTVKSKGGVHEWETGITEQDGTQRTAWKWQLSRKEKAGVGLWLCKPRHMFSLGQGVLMDNELAGC